MSYGGGRWNNNRNYNRRGNQGGWNNYDDYDNQQWRGNQRDNQRYNRHNNYNNDYDDSYNDNYNNNYNNQSRYNNNNRRDKYRKPNNNYQNRTNSNSNSNSNSNGNQNQRKNVTTTRANAATSAAKGNSSTNTNSNVPNGAKDETTPDETKANANTTNPSPNAQNKDSKTKDKNDKNEKNNKNEEDDNLDGDDDLDERHEFFHDDDSNIYDLIYYDEDYDECEDYINDWLDDEELPLTNVQESTLRCYLGSIYSRRDEAFYYAKEEFEKAIKLDNKNDLAYYEYGTMLYELKQYTNGLKNYEMAYKLKPDVKEYENDYNDAKKEITTKNLKDEPVPQELIEPPKEDDEDEQDDGDDNENVQGSGGKKEKETEKGTGKGKGKGKYKKLQGVPEDSEADGGYVDANDNEKENDGDGNKNENADGDDDEFLDDEDEEEDDYEEDDFETDFERFWDPFGEKWDPDNEYYDKFHENKLDDMKILATVDLNSAFEKDVLIGKIGMSKEHSSYFMKRLERIQGDNKRFCQWLRSIGLYDEYYSIFEDNEIVTFEAFYYWIQSEDDLLDCIESDTIDENSTDFKLLWETNPRYVRNNPKSDGSLLCHGCNKKMVAQAEECAAAAQANNDEGNNNQGNNDDANNDNLNVDQPGT